MKADDIFGPALYVLQEKLPQMRERGLTKATCHCKACGGKNTVVISRQPGKRGDIVRFACKTEGCGNRGMT